MDEQLKRRLMGATILTALAVIFVPMLFEDKSAGPAGAGPSGIPALPEPIEQRPMALPNSVADVVPAEESAKKPAQNVPGSSYRIVPLDDAPPKASKPVTPQRSTAQVESGAPEEDFAGDEGGEGAEAPPTSKAPALSDKAGKTKATVVQSRNAKAPVAARAADPVASTPTGGEFEGEEPLSPGEEEGEPPVRPSKSKAPQTAAKVAEGSGKKPEKAKSAQVPPPKSTPARTEPAKSATPPTPKSTAAKPAAPADIAGTPAKPPVTPAPVKPKEAPAPSAWVVQAGSFTGEANARSLADKLRKQNLPAYVHVSHKESGDVYRVTVGPELNRARAEQIQKQIESSVGIKGMILPHR